ncbi:MAG: hypothetical protein K2L32_07670 [Muribaculaceae bacterium]|nr:hypothetical protein [Muribaculaceae bacterium]
MSIQRLTSVERAGLLLLAAVIMVAAVMMALVRNSDSNSEGPAEQPAVVVDSLPGDAVCGDSVRSVPPRRRASARPRPAEVPVRNPLDDRF